MPSHNNDVLINGVGVLDLGDKAGCADDIEGGNAEQALGVVDAPGLEDLGDDRYGRVDGVGDDEDVGIWSRFSRGLGEVTNDGGVSVEKVVAGHARLSGDTGRDEDNFCSLQRSRQSAGCWVISGDLALGIDVRDISGDAWDVRRQRSSFLGQMFSRTWSPSNVVQGQLSDARIQLEEKGERLSNSTGSAKHSDFRELFGMLEGRTVEDSVIILWLTSRAEAEKALRWTAPVNALRVANMVVYAEERGRRVGIDKM